MATHLLQRKDEWWLLMTARWRWRIVLFVNDARPSDGAGVRVLTLEIDAVGDPISGCLSESGGAAGQRFVGWLGLARALELVLDAAGRPPSGHAH